ncbi:hypothetical protein [Aliiglaciecola litoralis]|uniref:Uncharacterized protein n=1 Tax=Aliiglaciecola litoralis TaxID=582857 RepID=A0ABP3WT55_9ALTE
MPDFSVTLDVQKSASVVGSKYINVQATNGQEYSFRYTGGSDGDGGITEIIGSGPSNITVTVSGFPRYEVSDIQFDNNDHNDLSHRVSADKSSVVITDTDVDPLNGYYKVLIKDTSAPQALLWCDPPIKNRT